DPADARGHPAGVPVPDGPGQQRRERQGLQGPITRERWLSRTHLEGKKKPAGWRAFHSATEAGTLAFASRRTTALGRGGRALGRLGRALGLLDALGLRPGRTLVNRALVRRTIGLRVRRTPVGRTFTLRARTLALALEGPFGLRTRLALHVAGALGHLGTPRACRLAILARLVAARALAGAQRLGGFLLQ